MSEGPGSQGTIAAQFNCEGTTLSGVEFELVGAGYRVSLVKRRFVSGEHLKTSQLNWSRLSQATKGLNLKEMDFSLKDVNFSLDS